MLEEPIILRHLFPILEEAQATEIKTLDVREQTSITDYMIIATGRSSRHVKATAANIIEKMKAVGFKPLTSHGLEQGDWVLIDFGDLIVHLMQADIRAFYNLEGLWEVKPQ